MKLTICALTTLLIVGCNKSSEQAKPAEEKSAAAEPAAPSYPGAATSAEPAAMPSGLKYIDLVVGSGATAEAGKEIVVHYSGYLTNGFKFDSSVDRDVAYAFPLGARRVIRGWDEGIAGMKVGGKRKLIIPPALGYGETGVGPIPPNAELVFDIELLDVK